MRKSLATPQQGDRRSLLGFGSANANSKKQRVPEQKKLNFSANRSRLHTSTIGVTGKRWSSQGTSMKDTRPLSNRAFQKQMVEDILEFLTESGYPHHISNKILGAPTSKEFLRVFEHLYGCINYNFKMEKKFEEEIPRILKTLNYPFTISKSAMFAVGSLHTWPTLLGALHWMVELIKTVNTVDMEQVMFPLTFQENELDKRHAKTFFNFYSDTYVKYMLGEDDLTETKEQLQQAIISDAGCSEEDHENLKLTVESLEKELAALEAESDPLEDAIKTKQMLEEKIQQDTMESQELDQKDEVTEKQFINLKKQLEEEGIDFSWLGDYMQQKEIKHKSAEVRMQLDRLNLERDQLEEQNNERELNYSKLYEKISTTLKKYNDFVHELSLNPHIKNYLGENSITLTFDHNHTDISSLHESKQKLKATLNQLSNQVAEDCFKLESQVIFEQDKIQKITEAITDRTHSLMQKTAQLERLDKELKDKESRFEEEYTGTFQNLISQEKFLESELKQIQQTLEEEKMALDIQKINLSVEVGQYRKEENDFTCEILSYCNEITKYRDAVKKGITAYNESVQAEIDHVKTLKAAVVEECGK